jgi:hypothetical protein
LETRQSEHNIFDDAGGGRLKRVASLVCVSDYRGTSCSDAELLGLVSFHFFDSPIIVSRFRSEDELNLERGKQLNDISIDAALLWALLCCGFDYTRPACTFLVGALGG